MKNMTQNIATLLRISGIYTIFRLISMFALIPFIDSYRKTQCYDFFFLLSNLSTQFFKNYIVIYFVTYILFTTIPLIIVTDFVCATKIIQWNKKAKRIASYRSLVTCLFGIFLVILALFVAFPGKFNPVLLIIEGSFYFLFYGTIFTLLMINEREERQ
jgi:hypothetical protein